MAFLFANAFILKEFEVSSKINCLQKIPFKIILIEQNLEK
jgi:hypothetical protein